MYTVPREYERIATKYAFSYGVDVNLVFAVIKTESNFYDDAVSDKGAVGLMQIMPQTAKYLCLLLDENFDEIDLFDAETNIRFGTYYLSYLAKKFPDRDKQILAYNAGEGNVKKWQTEFGEDFDKEQIPFRESAQYLEKVNRYLKLYKQKYSY